MTRKNIIQSLKKTLDDLSIDELGILINLIDAKLKSLSEEFKEME